MPRKVDHDARRETLVAALMRIVADRGLDEVSVREVAAAAGVSVGTVQHYFPSKDDMLLYAGERAFAAGLRRAAAVRSDGPVSATLRSTLHEFLPLDAERMVECRVWVAFAARAAVSPTIGTAQVEVLGEARAALAAALREAVATREIAAGIDADIEAVLLLAVLVGLTVHGVQDPAGHPPEVQIAVLDRHLDRLFGRRGTERGTAPDTSPGAVHLI